MNKNHVIAATVAAVVVGFIVGRRHGFNLFAEQVHVRVTKEINAFFDGAAQG